MLSKNKWSWKYKNVQTWLNVATITALVLSLTFHWSIRMMFFIFGVWCISYGIYYGFFLHRFPREGMMVPNMQGKVAAVAGSLLVAISFISFFMAMV